MSAELCLTPVGPTKYKRLATPWKWHIRSPRYLVPEAQLEPGDGEYWHALGSDALFRWEGRLPLAGWNMIEVDCERSVTGVATRLVFETRQGSMSVEMPLRAGKITKRLVRVPRGLKSVKLCPMNARGRFHLKHFRMVWLTPRFAEDRLLQRLVSSHPRHRGLTKDRVKHEVMLKARQRTVVWHEVALEEYDETFISLCSKRNYRQWINQLEIHQRPGPATMATQQQAWASTPTLSLVVPVVASGVRTLERGLEALLKQAYPHWQVTFVTAGDYGSGQLAALKHLVDAEPRAHWLGADRGDIDALVSLGLAQATGEWVGILSPGDLLTEDALFRFAQAINERPGLELIYADEDRLDGEGVRHSPHFKPDWNPDLLCSTAYLGSPVLFKREVLMALPVWRDQPRHLCPESLIHEWALRYLTYRQDEAGRGVARLPSILLHRCGARPPNDNMAMLSAIQRYLKVRRTNAVASLGEMDGSVRVRWPIPEPAPLVSLLVPTRNGVDILRPCVDAILSETHYRHFELLILDNQSSCPETLDYMQEVAARDSRVRVLRWNYPFNYSAINNFGAREAKGEILGLVNNDIEPCDPHWLGEMVAQVSRPDIGCVGAKLYYPNGTVQHGGVILGLGSIAGHSHRFFQRDEEGFQGRLKLTQNLSAVTAACLLVRKSVFEEVGGLNEPDLAVAYNDVDFCLKVREAGYRNLWTPYAELYHHESISRGADDTPKKRARWLAECAYMRRTWGRQLDNDPAYNPNLTLVHEDFTLR